MTFSAGGSSLWLSLEIPWRSQTGWVSAKRRLISNLGGCCTGNWVVILIVMRQHLWFVVEYGANDVHSLGSLWGPSICPSTFNFLHLSCHCTPLSALVEPSSSVAGTASLLDLHLLLCPSFPVSSVSSSQLELWLLTFQRVIMFLLCFLSTLCF